MLFGEIFVRMCATWFDSEPVTFLAAMVAVALEAGGFILLGRSLLRRVIEGGTIQPTRR